jgi:hypothetical protein
LLFGALALRFFQPRTRGAKALFSLKRTPKSWRPDGFIGLSVLQQFTLFKFFVKFELKSVAEDLHQSGFDVAVAQHLTAENLRFRSAYLLLIKIRNMNRSLR